MTNNVFGPDAMENVQFTRVDLRWSMFFSSRRRGVPIGEWGDEPPPPDGLDPGPSISFFWSNLAGTRFAAADLAALHFWESNLSGAQFFGEGLNAVEGNNWHVRGDPPRGDDLEGHEDWTAYVCDREIPMGSDPVSTPGCWLTASGYALEGAYFDYVPEGF